MGLYGFHKSARLSLIVLACFLTQVAAQTSSATFQYPPATMNGISSLKINVYDTGSHVNIELRHRVDVCLV
jgi:hypothetical protein